MSSPSFGTPSELLTVIESEVAALWRQGKTVYVEHYLELYPQLGDNATALLELIRVEIRLRRERGEQPQLQEYLKRFPDQAETLQRSWPERENEASQGSAIHDSNTTVPGRTAPVPLSHDSQSGPFLPGFELYERLGEGGMGVVYRARDIRLDQPRAVKLIRTGMSFAAETRERFAREAKAVARLNHPAVVRIFSVGEYRDLFYISMELLPGGNLYQLLRQGRLDIRRAADLVRQLALGVQHAHENQVVHRDLKPANVLLAEDGSARITDFGLAKLLDSDDGLTATGAVMGTPGYMAPEQAEGQIGSLDSSVDVWSLGVILYECLTGQRPFAATTRSQTLELVKTARPLPPRRHRPEVPADLEAICLKCLSKRPQGRYGSAGELAVELQNWLDGKGKPAARRPWLQSLPHLNGSRGRIACALLLLISGLGAVLLSNFAGEKGPQNALSDQEDNTASAAENKVKKSDLVALKQLYEDLEKGPVCLLDKHAMPRYYRWATEPDRPPLKPYDGGYRWIKALDFVCLCELLPHIQKSTYCYEGEIKLTPSSRPGRSGFYFMGEEKSTKAGRLYRYLSLTMSSIGPSQNAVLRLILENTHEPEPGGSSRASRYYLFAWNYPPGWEQTWHTLRVEVSAKDLTLSVDGKVLQIVPLATLDRMILKRELERRSNLGRLNHTGSLGLLVADDIAYFRNITFQVNPAN